MQNSSVESTKFPVKNRLKFGDRVLDLSLPVVMGIVNVTPDSFYGGSRSTFLPDILERVKVLLTEGASIIDLGAYSSRPGAIDISVDEEVDRIVPVVVALRKEFPEAILSVDTFRSTVAQAVLDQGANMINDISACSIDPKLASVVAAFRVPYVLMHMRGTPQTMHENTIYTDLAGEIHDFFEAKIKELEAAGIDQIIVDPGFGFSKTMAQNYALLNAIDHFHNLGKPILLGVSRKSMIYRKLGITPEEALPGTIALQAIGLSKGVSILRSHDVAAARQTIALLS